MFLTHQQAIAMLELQQQMNSKVNPDWLRAGYPFLRAVVVEGAEAMEHHGWKWWKAQTLDLEQLRMEMVDIWHFMLSDFLIEAKGDLPAAAEMVFSLSRAESDIVYFDGNRYDPQGMKCLDKLELLIGLSVVRRVSLKLFESLLEDCGMDWLVLFRQYVAKNVLNMFRQDFGYKQGSYQKEWAGREDNEHLVEIMSGLNSETQDYKTGLYEGLRARYTSLVLEAQA